MHEQDPHCPPDYYTRVNYCLVKIDDVGGGLLVRTDHNHVGEVSISIWKGDSRRRLRKLLLDFVMSKNSPSSAIL